MMSLGTGARAITGRSMFEAQACLVSSDLVGHPVPPFLIIKRRTVSPSDGASCLIEKYNRSCSYHIFTARVRTFLRRHIGELALCLIIFSIVAVAWILLLMQDPNWQYISPVMSEVTDHRKDHRSNQRTKKRSWYERDGSRAVSFNGPIDPTLGNGIGGQSFPSMSRVDHPIDREETCSDEPI